MSTDILQNRAEHEALAACAMKYVHGEHLRARIYYVEL